MVYPPADGHPPSTNRARRGRDLICVSVCRELSLEPIEMLFVGLLCCSVLHFSRPTARCYASAVLAMGLCPSVCPSQVGVLSKRLNVGQLS